jgi:hypothetical protein
LLLIHLIAEPNSILIGNIPIILENLKTGSIEHTTLFDAVMLIEYTYLRIK